MRTRKINKLNIIFYIALSLELVIFQFAWPLSLVRAEDAISDPPASEQSSDSSKSNSSTESNSSETTQSDLPKENSSESGDKPSGTESPPSDNSPTDSSAPQSPEVQDTSTGSSGGDQPGDDSTTSPDSQPQEEFWKTCDLSEEEKNFADKNDCQECKKLPACEEIKVCIQVKIENLNKSEVANESAALANTGDNTVGTAPDAQSESGQNENTDTDSEENPARNQEEESTGEKTNHSSQNPESVEISTGDAQAEANILNEINTNMVGENTQNVIETIDGVYKGDINLLEKFQVLLAGADQSKGENGNAPILLEIHNVNEAWVQNNTSAIANSGGNIIYGSDGKASISTGDAYAAVNIINIINTNLVGNNWLFVTINIFGNWIGDLIVPGEGLLGAPDGGGSSALTVQNENTADIENSAQVQSNTGENEIASAGNATIETGDAGSSANVKNFVNTNIIKNNWFFLIINNFGTWIGKAINWGGDSKSHVFSYEFDPAEDLESNIVNWIASIFNKNVAHVSNVASASANTGKNSIQGSLGDSSIATGDAWSSANILNLINTNIIGNNWMFAMVNVFGKWNGNVEFAYPDLEISITDGKDRASRGEKIHYQVKFENVGKANSEKTNIQVSLPDYIAYEGNSAGADHNGQNLFWELPALKSGESKSFTVEAVVSENVPLDPVEVETTAKISTGTKELQLTNNSASDDTELSIGDDLRSVLAISRKVSDSNFKAGSKVKHTIFVKNTGEDSLENIVLQDALKNGKGYVGTYRWKLGSLDAGKTAEINYTVLINEWAPSGDYKNKASALGTNSQKKDVNSGPSSIAFHVKALEVPNGENYYYYYENYPPVQYLGEDNSLVNTAEAAELPGKVLGTWTNGVCHKLPWWGWAAVATVYLAAIHWSLLRQRRLIKPVKNQ